ncbi:EAL domain-containing protein [Alkalibacillus aidingensis]|uniref:EAL domain-containing protein n=1 Tax=Alkalibacillus aidingensis TaxID=2747607 RepID=UPI0016604131|nr:EAL domain-containing protein [Alkalibacillus aidingensis]
MSVSKLETLIKNNDFYHLYQPIYDIQRWEIIGVEVLFRSDLFVSPVEVFELAKEEGKLIDLEKLSISKGITGFSNLSDNDHLHLYINVFPSTISNPLFREFLNQQVKQSNVKQQQIVIEIIESEAIRDLLELKSHIRRLKNDGFITAIDDVGKGASTLQTIMELEPQIIKMDHYFSEELPYSTLKQRMLESLLGYCRQTDTKMILEGIESIKILEVAKSLGIQEGQGFYLGVPNTLETFLADQPNPCEIEQFNQQIKSWVQNKVPVKLKLSDDQLVSGTIILFDKRSQRIMVYTNDDEKIEHIELKHVKNISSEKSYMSIDNLR